LWFLRKASHALIRWLVPFLIEAKKSWQKVALLKIERKKLKKSRESRLTITKIQGEPKVDIPCEDKGSLFLLPEISLLNLRG